MKEMTQKEQIQQLREKWTKFYTQYLTELKEQGWVREFGKDDLVIGVLHYHCRESGSRIDRAVELCPGYGITLPGYVVTNGSIGFAAQVTIKSISEYPDKYVWEDLISDEGGLKPAPKTYCKDCKPEDADLILCYGNVVICCVCGMKRYE